MKRQILLIVVMLTASIHLQAQLRDKRVSLIPRIGVNIADLKHVYGSAAGSGAAETAPLETKMKAGLLIGCDLEIELARPLLMDIGLYYSQQGCNFKDGRKAAQVDYLNIPVLLGVQPVEGLIIKAGLQPGFNLTDKNIDKATVSKITLGIPVGVSYEYKHVVLDARYVIGTSLIKADADPVVNQVVSITLGYSFSLGKMKDERPKTKYYMPASDGNY